MPEGVVCSDTDDEDSQDLFSEHILGDLWENENNLLAVTHILAIRITAIWEVREPIKTIMKIQVYIVF